MTRSEQHTAALAMHLLGFAPADIVRLFLIAGLPIPDLTPFRVSTNTERYQQ